MPTYNIGNPQRTSTGELLDGMLTCKNMTTKSYMFQEKLTPLLMLYYDPLELIKVIWITKILSCSPYTNL
jgi:hypothetical protein